MDEKKFKKKEIESMLNYSYGPVNECLSTQLMRFFSFFFMVVYSLVTFFSLKKLSQSILPVKMEIIDALGCVFSGPTLFGEIGNVGLVLVKCSVGCNLTIKDILLWIKKDLCSMLRPFPGPCSVVVFDNMPQHQKYEHYITK